MSKSPTTPARSSDGSVYPVSDRFENETARIRQTAPDYVQTVIDRARSVVKDYEHGVADVGDIQGVSIKQYAAVVLDLILTLE